MKIVKIHSKRDFTLLEYVVKIVKIYYKRDFTLLESCSKDSEDKL